MKQPESTIDVNMYGFGRLIDAVEETWCDCEIRNHDDKSVAEYKRARDRLEDAIRCLIETVSRSYALSLAYRETP